MELKVPSGPLGLTVVRDGAVFCVACDACLTNERHWCDGLTQLMQARDPNRPHS